MEKKPQPNQYISVLSNAFPIYICKLRRPSPSYFFQQGWKFDVKPCTYVRFMLRRAPQCPLLLQDISKEQLPAKVMCLLKPERTVK